MSARICFYFVKLLQQAMHFGMGPDGVFYAVTVAFTILSVVSSVLFKRGKWKLTRV